MADPKACLRRADAQDAATAATLHAHSFAAQERSWTAGEFGALLEIPGSFLLLAAPGPGAPDAALLLGRVQGDEAELLTLGAIPAARRTGLARALLNRFVLEAAAHGATTAFLEVATDNAPARALYAAGGWTEVGRRKGYVKRSDGRRVDALVLRLLLG